VKPGRAASGTEFLDDRVKRAKHRWLKRVMYDLATTSSEKCLAYLIMDHLNCVSVDSWPSQKRVADQFGWSTKTVHRVACALERRGHLRVTRGTRGSHRYAPIFMPEDEDKSGGPARQSCPEASDKNVEESSLGILTNQSSPRTGPQDFVTPKYEAHQRGRFEAELAKRLGNDGFEILARLSELDDAIVERLCRAHANGQVGERELSAARLAAEQSPQKRRAR
jgi:hypothetical protein